MFMKMVVSNIALFARKLSRLYKTRKGMMWLRGQFKDFYRLSKTSDRGFRLSWEDRFPCLGDDTSMTDFDRHYIYHTAWAARILARTKPATHVDISSALYFSAIASAFCPVDFYDFRPADIQLSDLTSGAADLTALAFADQSIPSLSCMHVVEHIGLGRYGDPLDPDGDLRAMRELARVLAPGGSLLFVVPVGKPVIQFNAHRIYAYRQILEAFPELKLREWRLIPR